MGDTPNQILLFPEDTTEVTFLPALRVEDSNNVPRLPRGSITDPVEAALASARSHTSVELAEFAAR